MKPLGYTANVIPWRHPFLNLIEITMCCYNLAALAWHVPFKICEAYESDNSV